MDNGSGKQQPLTRLIVIVNILSSSMTLSSIIVNCALAWRLPLWKTISVDVSTKSLFDALAREVLDGAIDNSEAKEY